MNSIFNQNTKTDGLNVESCADVRLAKVIGSDIEKMFKPKLYIGSE